MRLEILSIPAVAAILIFSSSAYADIVSHSTQDAKGMVDVCNATGGNGWMNDNGGHCIGKDGKTTTDCKKDTTPDNCTTITLTIKVKRPAKGFDDFARPKGMITAGTDDEGGGSHNNGSSATPGQGATAGTDAGGGQGNGGAGQIGGPLN